MSDANNAFATAYDLIATPVVPPGGDVVACTHSTPEFSVLFNESLAYDVVITARNPMDSTTVTKSVEIQEMVSGFLVVDGNSQVKANEVKLLNASFTAVGTKTCVYVDFGDGVKRIYSDFLPTCTHIASFSSVAIGDKLPLSSVYTMQHVYTTDGFYTVSATAQNDHSSETLTVSFSITALDCGKPAVDIHNRLV
ncbi:uncharacterized protein LOC106012064 [Aplysia californica]|uniref:Uncharacterized protein LOC106012064 n=1 Tax=Aplysia californica TaxID=6500 RepID=A0ABM1A214_APLCA|nr:uncharacterized protein LOC106012064 [Aplysia californica]